MKVFPGGRLGPSRVPSPEAVLAVTRMMGYSPSLPVSPCGPAGPRAESHLVRRAAEQGARAELRRYTSNEVVTLLGIEPTWLKRWVTADLVPRQRSGAQCGVWFTYAHICAIGRLLPNLMTGRQANGRAEESNARAVVVIDSQVAKDVAPDVSDDEFASFLHLRSVR